MRKRSIGSLLVLGLGLLLANGAVAADQPEMSPEVKALFDRMNARLEKLEAEKAAAATPAEKKDDGLLSGIFQKIEPDFGGDANIEWDTRDSNQGDGLTSRVRLTMDAKIDEFIYLHTRMTAKQYITGHESDDGRGSQMAGYENEAINVGMEQLYLGAKFSFLNTEVRAGRQPLWLANGMLADINGINGIYLRSTVAGVNALGFVGREGIKPLQGPNSGKETDLYAAEFSKGFGPVEVGATWLKVDENFYGVNASYRTPWDAVLWGQYVKNDDASDDDTGYRVGVNYGNAAKKGEWDISLAYLRVEDNINPNKKWFVNDGNWVGAEGVRIKAHYALTDYSTLVVVQDFFDNINSDNKQNRTDIEWEVRF